jgi:hypothetical protein
MSRVLSTGFLLMSLALLPLAAFDYVASRGNPGVMIDERELQLSGLTAGQTLAVAFRIRNPTGHAARVVGLEEC